MSGYETFLRENGYADGPMTRKAYERFLVAERPGHLYKKGLVKPFEYAGLQVYDLEKQDLIQLLALALEYRGFSLEWDAAPKP